MARLFVTGINLNKNELQNARIHNLSAAPSSPVAGQIYFDTITNVLYFYNGTEWVPASGSTEVIQDVIGSSVSGGTGLTAAYNDTSGITTLDLDNTAVTAGNYGTTAAKTASFTVDAQGRLTAANQQDIQIATSQVTDLAEFIDDTVGDAVNGLVQAGEGIDVTYDDNAGTLTIAGEDATSSNKGVASFDATDFTVTSGAVTLNVDRIEDVAANLIVAGTGLNKNYDDGAATLTINIDSTVTTNNGTQTLTNKTLGAGNSLSSDLNASNNKITGLATPTNATDAATKGYVDSTAIGLDVKLSVRAATTANIDLTADLENGDVLDGVTLATGNRVLVKNQTDQTQNGIYVVAASGAASRSEDANSDAEVTAGLFTFVEEGTVNGNTGYVLTSDNPITLGSTNLVFSQFSGSGTFTAGAGLTLAGTVFSADVTPTSGNASLTNTGGAIEVKTDTSRGLSVDANGLGINAGTGFTFAANALAFASGYGVRKHSQNVGNDAATSITVSHNFGTQDVVVHVYDNASPYAQVEADIEHTNSNDVTIKFAAAPTSNQYRVVVVG
jgi:hypothetical protein